MDRLPGGLVQNTYRLAGQLNNCETCQNVVPHWHSIDPEVDATE